MNDYKYHYLFTTFVSAGERWECGLAVIVSCLAQDIETFDLEAFKYNFVNITAFRVVDSEYFRVTQVLKEMERVVMPGYNQSVISRSRILQVYFIRISSIVVH